MRFSRVSDLSQAADLCLILNYRLRCNAQASNKHVSLVPPMPDDGIVLDSLTGYGWLGLGGLTEYSVHADIRRVTCTTFPLTANLSTLGCAMHVHTR